jgi:putative MATE family efflux protein
MFSLYVKGIFGIALSEYMYMQVLGSRRHQLPPHRGEPEQPALEGLNMNDANQVAEQGALQTLAREVESSPHGGDRHLARSPAPGRGVAPRVLAGPIVPTLLRLAIPTVIVLVIQTLVGIAETYFVSSLGTDALAGVALVFPVLMLMQMMSNGGIGGGVSSAVARALGAGRSDDAQALVWHAIVLACLFGIVFTIGAWLGGPLLYRALGGHDGVLLAAVTYSQIVFAGSVPIWLVALLAAALRGSGNVKVPALVTLASAAVLIPLSPALIFGWGPFPRLGIAGAGTAVVIYYIGAAIALIGYMLSSRSVLRLSLVPLDGRLMRDVLGVGGLSAIGTLQVNLTVACVTGAVGLFGSDAIAGYGAASRLDYVLIPVLFGLGTAIVTMVGTNIGAQQYDRAQRIAWIGAAIAFGATEVVGLLVALFPHGWLGLFTNAPDVLATGSLYLRTVAPVYGAVGIGMILYFAGQGANRVLWPVLAGTARMIVAALGGWLVVTAFHGGLSALFLITAASALLFAGINILATLRGWR